MKIAVISFTIEGRKVAERLMRLLRREGHIVNADVKGTSFPDSVSCSVTEWAGKNLGKQDALVFVGAAGIAVRAVAPHICSKTKDAAVIVIDERGDYCIPVLSGHIGGANELALMISRELPALPVITTATDIQRKWAADVFAVKNELVIRDLDKVKQISARILAGERLRLFCDADEIRYENKYSDSLEIEWKGDAVCTGDIPDIYVGYDMEKASEKTLCLIPCVVTAGIGCKRGTDEGKIRSAVEGTLEKAGIFKEALKRVASINLKKGEEGLVKYCKDEKLFFVTCSAEELQAAEGTFSGSGFVKQVTGVDNVCERSAVLAGGGLLIRKQVYEGVTVALAAEKWSVCFE